MLRLLVLLVALLSAQARVRRVFYALEDAEHHFDQFIATFDKQYASEQERNFRLNIFKENLKDINELNSKGQAIFGITKFTDLTKEEFKQKHTGFRYNAISYSEDICKKANVAVNGTAPDSVDWRTKGKVTKVKDQGQCGSCWAFSTTGNLEGQYAIKHDKLVEFSEQQLVDCDLNDLGCTGGLMNQAFTWLKQNDGEETEADYPYMGEQRDCKFEKGKTVLQVTDCNKYEDVTEDQLKKILADVGPLSIAVDATDFMKYHGGVLECTTNEDIDHGVLLVGYGTEGGKPYWIVKNSWGDSWGEKGYVRLEMNKNSCLLLTYISSAVVA